VIFTSPLIVAAFALWPPLRIVPLLMFSVAVLSVELPANMSWPVVSVVVPVPLLTVVVPARASALPAVFTLRLPVTFRLAGMIKPTG